MSLKVRSNLAGSVGFDPCCEFIDPLGPLIMGGVVAEQVGQSASQGMTDDREVLGTVYLQFPLRPKLRRVPARSIENVRSDDSAIREGVGAKHPDSLHGSFRAEPNRMPEASGMSPD
jgi:hypothetical protein